MKINEVEKILDIPKATIRFYEKQGLLTPQRSENTYRDYSDADVERLKRILILRKVGMPVEDIKLVLSGDTSLPAALSKNMVSLQQQMAELEGAMKLCALLHKQEESISSLDEAYYWELIHREESQGSKFFDIVNDVLEFEKRVIADEFGLLGENGKLRFSIGKSVLIALLLCAAAGLLWFFLDGMNIAALAEGFLFPFECILISSIFGLPVFFLEKKNEKAAKIIKKIGAGIGIAALIAVVLMMIFLEA